MLGAVWLAMTGCALWHDLSVVLFQRVVGMKYFMAFPAIKLMLAAGIFEVTEVTRMTLTALRHAQWLWFNRVETGVLGWQICSCRSLCQGG